MRFVSFEIHRIGEHILDLFEVLALECQFFCSIGL